MVNIKEYISLQQGKGKVKSISDVVADTFSVKEPRVRESSVSTEISLKGGKTNATENIVKTDDVIFEKGEE